VLTVDQAHALREQIVAAPFADALPATRRFGFGEAQAEVWVQSFTMLAREIEAERDVLSPDVVDAYRDAARALRGRVSDAQRAGRHLLATTLRQAADELDAALA